jgi:hypothetical protein
MQGRGRDAEEGERRRVKKRKTDESRRSLHSLWVKRSADCGLINLFIWLMLLINLNLSKGYASFQENLDCKAEGIVRITLEIAVFSTFVDLMKKLRRFCE